jgi:2-(1,2-epoxy-1,2-dihydrophenyl)acetyl-CoA isomerase
MTSLIEYAARDGVSHLTLNRPEASNSFDLPTAGGFADAVAKAAADDTGAVLLTGAGPRFCAGGDVSSMRAGDDPSSYLLELANVLDGALQALTALEKPVVAAVQGAAAGAGLAVVLSADVVVSARSTKYLTAYANLALTPDCGLSHLLPRAVGQQRALDLLLTGRALSADEALDWGIVTEVADDDAALARAEEIAARLASGPTWALGQAKRLSRTSWAATRAEVGADEARTIAQAVTTDDAVTRIAKFLSR